MQIQWDQRLEFEMDRYNIYSRSAQSLYMVRTRVSSDKEHEAPPAGSRPCLYSSHLPERISFLRWRRIGHKGQ